MVDRFDIKDGMEVVGSDGVAVGTVADVETGRMILRPAAGEREGRHVPLSHVERVADGRVHLNESSAVLFGGFAARVAEATGDPMPDQPRAPRGKAMLLWIIGGVLLLGSLLIVYLRTLDRERETLAAPPQIEAGPVSPVSQESLDAANAAAAAQAEGQAQPMANAR